MTIDKVFWGSALLSVAAVAQVPQPVPADMHTFEHRVMGPAIGGVMLQADGPAQGMRQMTVQYVSSEAGMPGKLVKGSPYSAEAVTDTTQTLPDGNRIRHKSTALVYRDSEGRTRRDTKLEAMGLAERAELPQLVFINDPVAGFNYILNSKERTAQKSKMVAPDEKMAALKMDLEKMARAGLANGGNAVFVTSDAEKLAQSKQDAEANRHGVRVQAYSFSASSAHGNGDVKSESLGQKVIEGVTVEGRRTTH